MQFAKEHFTSIWG